MFVEWINDKILLLELPVAYQKKMWNKYLIFTILELKHRVGTVSFVSGHSGGLNIDSNGTAKAQNILVTSLLSDI